MDPFDELVLNNYFSLNSRISQLQRYRKEIRQVFYLQNMTTRTMIDELGLSVKGVRPDEIIEKLTIQTEIINHRIERYLFRKKHFTEFWTSLTSIEQRCLLERFRYKKESECSEKLILQVLAEVKEIETAICFREGIEPDKAETELLEDVEENLERMCDFFVL